MSDPLNDAIVDLYKDAANTPTPATDDNAGCQRWMMSQAGRVPILPDDQIEPGPLGDQRRKLQREQHADDARTGRTRP